MIGRELLRIFFPTPCLLCGYLSEALCWRCYESIPFEPHVRTIKDLKVCSALYYEENSLIEKLIHPFKYQHQADLYRLLVPPMKRALELLMEPKDLILVPVPLHRKRFLERGYNQAELLAKNLARNLGCRYEKLLSRVRDTGYQAHVKNREERICNMAGAFSVSKQMPSGQIVLVDDIVTTGSTLIACAEALRAAGASSISALTLADRD